MCWVHFSKLVNASAGRILNSYGIGDRNIRQKDLIFNLPYRTIKLASHVTAQCRRYICIIKSCWSANRCGNLGVIFMRTVLLRNCDVLFMRTQVVLSFLPVLYVLRGFQSLQQLMDGEVALDENLHLVQQPRHMGTQGVPVQSALFPRLLSQCFLSRWSRWHWRIPCTGSCQPSRIGVLMCWSSTSGRRF